MSTVIDLEARGNLRRNLKKTAVGLDKGMTPAEIRDWEVWQIEAQIRHASQRLAEHRASRVRAAAFLRTLADELEMHRD